MSSRENITAVFRKKGKVEKMEMFESKASFLCVEMEKFPVDPVDFGVSISFPEEVRQDFVDVVENMDRKFVDGHGVDKDRLENRFDESDATCKIKKLGSPG